MKRRAAAFVVALGLAAAACGERSRAEPSTVSRPEPVTVTVANTAVRPVERTVSVVGTLAPTAQAELASEIEGPLVAIEADLGDRVRRDQVLARVREDEIQAKLREAEASLEKAVADEGRGRPLRGNGVISAQEYEQVRTALEVARARRDQLRIQLERAAIRSPLEGSVAARLLAAGCYVKQGTVVFRLVQDDPLKFRGDVPERDVPILASGQDVRITVDAFPGEPFVGHLRRRGAAHD